MKINSKLLLLSLLVAGSFNAKAVSGWKVAAGVGILAGGYLVYKLYDKYKYNIGPAKSNVVYYDGLSQIDTTRAGYAISDPIIDTCLKSGAQILQKTFSHPQFSPKKPYLEIKITERTLNGTATYQIEKYILGELYFRSNIIMDVNLPKLQNVVRVEFTSNQDGTHQLLLIQDQYNCADILSF